MKYTIEYLKSHPVAVSCPTKGQYIKVVNLLGLSFASRPDFWDFYKEQTKVSYTFRTDGPIPHPIQDDCYGSAFEGFDIITAERLFIDNQIFENYEIY